MSQNPKLLNIMAVCMGCWKRSIVTSPLQSCVPVRWLPRDKDHLYLWAPPTQHSEKDKETERHTKTERSTQRDREAHIHRGREGERDSVSSPGHPLAFGSFSTILQLSSGTRSSFMTLFTTKTVCAKFQTADLTLNHEQKSFVFWGQLGAEPWPEPEGNNPPSLSAVTGTAPS